MPASSLALHELDEVRPTTQEEFVVVRSPVWTCSFPAEVPPRDLSCERSILGEGEEVWRHVLHEGVLVDDLFIHAVRKTRMAKEEDRSHHT